MENTITSEKTRHSTRQRKPTYFRPDFVALLLENDPHTFKVTMSLSDSTFWKESVNSMVESILSNHTWKLTDVPQKNKTLGPNWICKRKMKWDY